jgi:hypothetical protein
MDNGESFVIRQLTLVVISVGDEGDGGDERLQHILW